MKTKETKMEYVCEFCGYILTEEETRRLNNVEMCESCFNSRTTNCDCCGTRIWRDELYVYASTEEILWKALITTVEFLVYIYTVAHT